MVFQFNRSGDHKVACIYCECLINAIVICTCRKEDIKFIFYSVKLVIIFQSLDLNNYLKPKSLNYLALFVNCKWQVLRL